MQARDSSLGIILPEVGQQLAGFIVFHAQTLSKELLFQAQSYILLRYCYYGLCYCLMPFLRLSADASSFRAASSREIMAQP